MRPFSATTSGVPPPRAMRSTIGSSVSGTTPPSSTTQRCDRVGRAFADDAAGDVDARHAGLRGEGHELRVAELVLAQTEAILGEHDDRAALGGLVGQARELRRLGQRRLVDAGHGEELGRLAVAERDRAGLVEQQRRAVAGGLDRAAAHREHVALHQPVHAGDADRRQQRADRRRDQAHQQRDQHDDRLLRAAE